jgi:para-aminobenzoate synthetase/4-amino-4-deoxychorismate lyase
MSEPLQILRDAPWLRFDFVDERGLPRTIQFDRPIRTIVAQTLADVRPAMREVDAVAGQGLYAAGFVCYEAAPAFDSALTAGHDSKLPLAWFGVFAAPSPVATTDRQVDSALDRTRWTADTTSDEHAEAIGSVRRAIAAGDVYQANYTFRLAATLDPRTIEARYQRLLAEHRAPYSAYLDIGRWRILSLSPELFFRLRDRHIVTKPMKGTAPRGLWLDDDSARRAQLAASEKDRAENVMIVDLMRNDLGRIAEIGSVQVRSLFQVERYPSILQLVSTIEARVRAETTIDDVFAALFPAGSITGAPKTSSMKLLAELEAAPRGVYCGAIGLVAPGGDAVFNVAIRTAVIDAESGHATFGIGGGVTWDSTAAGEYAEALTKAGCLDVTPAFDLFETMRLEKGRYVRREGHLHRLRTSAVYCDFAYDDDHVARTLDDHAAQHANEVRRVRLRLARNGTAGVESWALEPLSDAPRPIVLATAPVSSANRLLYHKTTRREIYDAQRAAHPGAFDVLLWNEERELTEFTIGNLVVEINGQRWTPPRRCGLLAGVFREELLARGEIHERVLTTADLAAVTAIWRISSLREWTRVTLTSARTVSTLG